MYQRAKHSNAQREPAVVHGLVVIQFVFGSQERWFVAVGTLAVGILAVGILDEEIRWE